MCSPLVFFSLVFSLLFSFVFTPKKTSFNYQMFEPFWGSIWPPEDSCASYLRDACSENSWQQTSALRYEVPSGSYQDYMLADFLLIRGPYGAL